MFRIHGRIWGCAAAVIGAAAWAAGETATGASHWSEQLTLQPSYVTSVKSDADDLDQDDQQGGWPELAPDHLNAFEGSKYMPAAPASGSGLDFSPVFDNATAVEYRTRAGLGVGFATNDAWCFSQVIRLGSDAGLSIYHLRGMGKLAEDGIRRTGIEPPSNLMDRTIGVSLQVRF